MCGIAGIFYYADPQRSVDRNVLVRMTRSLEHRGPDDEGFHEEAGLGLGHRRLSIVDLSVTGHQPMSADDGCVIIYNGEAYNHGEFRDRLRSSGIAFKGTSDTETILHLLRERGPDALADIAGIFGLAFWDARERRLTLARDPIGVKQLYFHDDGRRVVFASEIKAVLEGPDVPRRINPRAFNEYLHFHGPLFERTFFGGIRQVRPGEFVQFARHGRRERAYWQIGSSGAEQRPSADARDELHALLGKVVRQQLMSDVPVGAFFSGGIDSSAIAAFAHDANPSGPKCFGVHFSGQGVIDEAPFQLAASRALGLELELITVDGAKFPEDLSRLLYYQDQPVVGPALLPMYYVSALARRSVKVCLGGQGADEVFAGYARHALVAPLLALRSMRGRTGGPPSGEQQTRVGGNLLKQLADLRNLRRLLLGARYLGDWRRRYFKHFAKVPGGIWKRLAADRRIFDADAAYATFHDHVSHSAVRTPLQKVLLWEAQTYLPSLLHQDDRMSMANSLESRVPLADPRIVSYAMRIPNELKLKDGATKWILRQAVAKRLPADVVNRRKAGFDTPAEAWMRSRHRGFVRETLLSKKARERGLFDPGEVEKWLNNPGRAWWFDVVWKLLCTEVWALRFLDRQPEP